MTRKRRLRQLSVALALGPFVSACSPQLVKDSGALAISLTPSPLLVTKVPLLPPEDPPAPPPALSADSAPEPSAAPKPQPPTPSEIAVKAAAPAAPPTPHSLGKGEATIWPRLTRGFTLSGHRHPEVQRFARRYSAHRRSTRRMLARAEPFLYDILVELEARKLPLELALVPAVESHYNPFAYSPRHAAGLWQFMPGTALHWGLRSTPWYDGRLDTRAATEAALDYLQFLHRRFSGDWLLALAAYNAGEGRVDKAMSAAKHGRDFWQLKLPRETQRYVPNLLGLAELIATPQQYGVDLPPLPNRAQLVQVPLAGPTPLAQAAALAGLSLADLQLTNPALKRTGTDPAGPHYLYLPQAAAKRLTQSLRLPENARLAAARNAPVESSAKNRAQPLKVAVAKAPEAARRFSYTVQAGDSLWDISRKHYVSIRRLAAWNGLQPDSPLKPGRQLTLWLQEPPHQPPSFTGVVYTVGEGESLVTIAKRFGLDVAGICAWNGLAQQAVLAPGLKLKLLLPRERRRASL
ncbi:MAG: transglycosylase SLT domain-containing protein [Nevskiales bacterium]